MLQYYWYVGQKRFDGVPMGLLGDRWAALMYQGTERQQPWTIKDIIVWKSKLHTQVLEPIWDFIPNTANAFQGPPFVPLHQRLKLTKPFHSDQVFKLLIGSTGQKSAVDGNGLLAAGCMFLCLPGVKMCLFFYAVWTKSTSGHETYWGAIFLAQEQAQKS